MLFNPQFANNIPHEYLATAKFNDVNKFDETNMLEVLPSLSMIKIADYLNKVCLLYTSPSPRDATLSRMPSSA